MWRVAGRLPQTKSLLNLSSTTRPVTPACLHTETAYRSQSQQQLSQPYETGQQKPPEPPKSSRGRASKTALIGTVGLLTVGGILLTTDENSRLASLEYLPQLKTVYEALNLSVTQKSLPPPPPVSKERTPLNVPQIAQNSVSRLTVPDVQSGAKLTKSEQTMETSTQLPAPENSSSQAPSNSACEDHTSITCIADSSVQFLFSGKRAPVDPQTIAKQEVINKEAEIKRAELQAQKKGKEELARKEAADHGAAQALQRKKRAEDEERRRQELIQKKEAKNAEIEQTLSRLISQVTETADRAVTANRLALDMHSTHTEHLSSAMAADKDEEAREFWSKLKELRGAHNSRSKEAEAATEEFRSLVNECFDYIEAANKDEFTHDNDVLPHYERQAKQLSTEVENLSQRLAQSDSAAQVMNYYHQLMEQDRHNFETEIAENFPDMKPGNEGDKLNEDELASLLIHAHRRIYQLKKQILEQQVLEEKRREEAMAEQRRLDEGEMRKDLAAKMEKQEHDVAAQLDMERTKLQKERDEQMRAEVGRAILAHHNHLQDMLALQQQQLMAKFEKVLNKRIDQEKSVYLDGSNQHTANLDRLTNSLQGRADVEKSMNDIQALMGFTQALQDSLMREGGEPTNGSEYMLTNIREPIEKGLVIAEQDNFVRTVLAAIPEQALEQGVYTSDSIEKRFESVYEKCKSLALNPCSDGIFKSALSKVYSKVFIWSLPPKYNTVGEFMEHGTAGMNDSELLVQAHHFIHQKCLEPAVLCMLELCGMPRTLAEGWLEEARLLLEVRQASLTLTSYAQTRLLGSIF